MRREDIELRAAARAGDARASLLMAQRLFAGGRGLPRNPTLGLAYLQQQLHRRDAEALRLAAQQVPLETLASQQLLFVLEGSSAGAKRAAWALFDARTREAALAQLAAAGAPAFRGIDPGCARTLALALGTLPRDCLHPGPTALAAAAEALREGRTGDAAFALRVAAESLEPAAVADAVWSAVRALREARLPAPLAPAIVESALRIRAHDGDGEAQYALGRALAGLPYAALPAHALVRAPQHGRAQAWLLRAADGGRAQAWFDLHRLCATRGGSHEAESTARYYLEKAAQCGVPEAQAELGQLLLAQARSLAEAERAVEWLWAAAQRGCADAARVLHTLVLPVPAVEAGLEQRWLQRIASADADLGMRARLARTLGLTRQEALSFQPARDLRPWGLVLSGSAKENPKGRVAPAASAAMRDVLEQARAFYGESSALAGTLTLHRSRMQRQVFRSLALDEAGFFAATIGRRWTHGGWGRHWAASRRADASEGVAQADVDAR